LGLRRFPYKYLVATAFVAGLFMDIMDTTIVNVALPTLGERFHAGNATLEWVVTGYLLSLAVWVPASGWVGDRFGTKRTFLFALTMFTLGSALCGIAPNIGALIAFRILQGVGGGMMTPVGTAMLYRAFPPHERAQASAILSIPTFIAPTLGPILGGWLVTDVSWRWIFYVNLPVGVLGIIFCALFLREHTEEKAGSFDVLGFLFSGIGLASVLYALSQAPEVGWTSPRVAGVGLAGILLFVALVVVELRIPEPMLQLRLFRDRMFRGANLVGFALSCTMIGILFLLPLFLQQLLGLTALESGLTTFPQALGMLATVQLTSRLYPRIGPRRMMAAGLLGVTLSSSLFLFVGLGTDLWWIRGIMLLRGISMAFAMIPMQVASFATISRQDTGRASSLTNTNRQVAGSFGVAVLATVLVSRTTSHVRSALASAEPATAHAAAQHATLLAFHEAFGVALIFAVIGIAFTAAIHDEDAAASMRRVTLPDTRPAEPVSV
jgi:EmrB/QacA subfamily drug resistance transporter